MSLYHHPRRTSSSISMPSLFLVLHVICQCNQSHPSRPGITLIIYPSQTQTLDILVRYIDLFTEALLHGWRVSVPGSPIAFETVFGWVLAGPTSNHTPESIVASHHTLVITSDDLLQRVWEIEEETRPELNLSPEEKSVVNHFKGTHRHTPDGRFIVPLPKKPSPPSLGESQSQAVRRFLPLKRSLRSKVNSMHSTQTYRSTLI